MIVGFSRSVSPLTVTLQENYTADPAWTNVTGTADIEFFGTSPGPDGIGFSLRAVVTGGVPPYTYSWLRVSGSFEYSADTDSASETTFTIDSAGNGYTIETAVWKCTVTDSRLVSADPATNAQLYAEGGA